MRRKNRNRNIDLSIEYLLNICWVPIYYRLVYWNTKNIFIEFFEKFLEPYFKGGLSGRMT